MRLHVEPIVYTPFDLPGPIGALPDDIQVTGYGAGSDFCGLNFAWTHAGADTIVRDVNCFTNAGAPSAAGFLISDNSAL